MSQAHWYLWVNTKQYNMWRLSAGRMCAAEILCIDLRQACSFLFFLQCGVFLRWLLWEKYLFLSHPLTASHRGDAKIYCMHTQQQACRNLVHALNQRLVHSDKKQTWRTLCVFLSYFTAREVCSQEKGKWPKHRKQEVVNHTGYPDKAVVSIATPSCATNQPIRDETLTVQAVMFTTLPEHAITSVIGFISMHAHSLVLRKVIMINRSARVD